MKRLLLAAALAVGLTSPVYAQPVQGKWSICDPVNPSRCLSLTPNTAAINISTAATTTLVAGTAGMSILVTAWDVLAGGTGNFTLEHGTGGCTTGLTAFTGPYNLAAQAGLSKGNGQGVVYATAPGEDLCAVTSAAVQYSGSVTYLKN